MKIKTYFDIIVNFFAILLLAVLTYVTFHQVVARTLGHPADWTEELSRFLFIWVSFIGAAIAFRYGTHLGVDFVVKLLPEKARKGLALLINLLLLAAIGLMFWVAAGMISDTNQQLSPTLRLPMSYPYLALPVGFGLMFIEVAWNLAMDALGKSRDRKVPDSLEEP